MKCLLLLALTTWLICPVTAEAKDQILYLECSLKDRHNGYSDTNLLRYQINLTRNTADMTTQVDNFSKVHQYEPKGGLITDRQITLKSFLKDGKTLSTTRINRNTGIMTLEYIYPTKEEINNPWTYKCNKQKAPKNKF